jgi:hypothetical protein
MLWWEWHSFLAYFTLNHRNVSGIMLVSSLNAVCYNAVHALVIKRTSAVTTTVIGEIKIVGLLIFSAMLLGEGKDFTAKMLLGCMMAMTGFIMYSHAKLAKVKMVASILWRVSRNRGNGGGTSEEDAPLMKESTLPS